MKPLALVLAAATFVAVQAAAWPGGPPSGQGMGSGMGPGMGMGFAAPRPEEVIGQYASELGIRDDTLAQIRSVGDQQRDESRPLVDELRQQKLALRSLLESANPEEGQVVALARKIGSLETELSVSRLRAMVHVHALLTPEQNAALHQKLRGRFEARRAKLDAATSACAAEIAANCPERGAGPPWPPLMCLMHKRHAGDLTVSAGCDAALKDMPPPHWGPGPGMPGGPPPGDPLDGSAPPPPDGE